jgi:hypothetical protein
MMRFIIILLSLSILAGCSSVTIRTDDQVKSYVSASYQKNVSYWWWGFSGEHYINVREVCKGQAVKQVQAVTTFTDSLATIFTLGIYVPRTARVWCDSNNKREQELKDEVSL